MSMRCKVNNRITPLEVHNMILEEEDMEAVEDMKVEEAIETEEGVEEHLAEEEDRSSIIIANNRVTLPETVQWLHVHIVKLPIMLLKSA